VAQWKWVVERGRAGDRRDHAGDGKGGEEKGESADEPSHRAGELGASDSDTRERAGDGGSGTGDRMEATLAVLAGGSSRRMGRPKALLPIGKGTLIEWVIERLAPAFAEVLVTGGPSSPLPQALQPLLLLDEFTAAGPLAGIETALGAARHDRVLVVACDLPGATASLARRLVTLLERHDAVVPRLAGEPQPTLATYHRRARPVLRRRLRAGQLRVQEALTDLDVRWVDDADPVAFLNCNAREDWLRARRLASGHRP
jgi:molybdopterin-guanine dinucleotide biosynthesis protein A